MITVKELTEKLRKNDYDITLLNDEECILYNKLSILDKHEGRLVKHFKNKLYLVLGTVEHTETGEELVVYKAMYGDYKKYARPIDMFLSKVDKVKYPNVEQEYRMEFIEIS
jgi:hypothetical protein